MTTTNTCSCGKVIPWIELESDAVDSIYGSSIPPYLKEWIEKLYQERMEIEKQRRLAAFDLVEGLDRSCSFSPALNSSDMHATEIYRRKRGHVAREMLLLGQLCFGCARKYATGQDITIHAAITEAQNPTFLDILPVYIWLMRLTRLTRPVTH